MWQAEFTQILQVGDIVISTDCVQHDIDVEVLGYALGTIPDESPSWDADPQLRAIAKAAALELAQQKHPSLRVLEGRVASGDQFIASKEGTERLSRLFGAACTEMEGAAVAQVCAKAGIPFVVIRSISDTADHDANVDYREFMPKVARNAKQVARGMLARLNTGHG